jgi:uncharacterized protein (DUF2062 family)
MNATVKTMEKWTTAAKDRVGGWLRMGVSPRRLALTLALGFAIGCFPMFGIPTALCAVIALAFGLNVPAMQAANYAAMPLQFALILPYMRLGGWMFSSGPQFGLKTPMLTGSSLQMLWGSGHMAGHALAAWLVIAGPMVLLLTFALTPVLQKVPLLASEVRE